MELDDFIESVTFSQSGLNWAQSFRRKRVKLLTSRESPISFVEGCKVFIHVIPYAERVPVSFREDAFLEACRQHGKWAEVSNYTYNIDGCLRYAATNDDGINAFLLYLRNGTIEQGIVYPGANRESTVPGQLLDQHLLYNIPDAIETLIALGQSYPLVAYVTITGVKDWTLAGLRNARPIDRNELWPEGVIFEKPATAIEKELTPLIDALWNASGLLRSPSM